MKFPAHSLNQLIVLGASCICFTAGAGHPGGDAVPTRRADVGSGLRGRELSTDNTISIDSVQISYTWQPAMELDMSVSCEGHEAGRCAIQASTPVTFSRPDGYGDHVLTEVCKNGSCMTLFSPTSESANMNCLTIPDGSGKYRGIKLSSNKDVKAKVFASGEVECMGSGEFTSCRTDYSWLPDMVLDVVDDYGTCQNAAGCSIEGNLEDTACSTPFGSIEIARPEGYGDHVIQEVYSSAWINGAVTSFRAASEGTSNIEDCLTDRIGSTDEYEGITLSSNSNATIQAVVSEDGSVFCRSLYTGSACTSHNQCLTDICKPYADGSNQCDDSLAAFGEYCTSDSDCQSDYKCNSNVNRCDDKVGEIGAMCSDDQHCLEGGCVGTAAAGSTISTCALEFGEVCASDSGCRSGICNPNVNRCDTKEDGSLGAMCSDSKHCTTGRCVGDNASGTDIPTCALVGYGEYCEADSDCVSGRVCNSNVDLCDTDDYAIGTLCLHDGDCCGNLKCGTHIFVSPNYRKCQQFEGGIQIFYNPFTSGCEPTRKKN